MQNIVRSKEINESSPIYKHLFFHFTKHLRWKIILATNAA